MNPSRPLRLALIMQAATMIWLVLFGSSSSPAVEEPEDPFRKRLSEAIIPILTFQRATVREAIEFLKKKGPDQNIELRLDPGPAVAVRGPAIPGLQAVPGSPEAPAMKESREPLVTLRLRHIPVWDAYRYTAAVARLKLRTTERGLLLEPLIPGERRFVAQPIPAEGNQSRPNIASLLVNLVIPKVELREATIEEALDFFHLKAESANIDEAPGPVIPNLVYLPGKNPEGGARITLSLDGATLGHVLQRLADLAGCQMAVEEKAVVFWPKDE